MWMVMCLESALVRRDPAYIKLYILKHDETGKICRLYKREAMIEMREGETGGIDQQ